MPFHDFASWLIWQLPALACALGVFAAGMIVLAWGWHHLD